MWQPGQVTDAGMIELFDELADRVRNPMLAYLGSPEDRGDWGDTPPSEAELLAERRLLGAVMLASTLIIDECIEDIKTIGLAEADPDDDLDPESCTDTFVWSWFPPRFRASYDQQFFTDVLVSAVKVSHDLANPKSDRPACVAEEIIVSAICKNAYTLMDDAGLDYDESLVRQPEFVMFMRGGLRGVGSGRFGRGVGGGVSRSTSAAGVAGLVSARR